MASARVLCRIHARVRLNSYPDKDHWQVNLKDLPNLSEDIRKQWARRVSDLIETSTFADTPLAIRPWDLLLSLDGDIEALPVPQVPGDGPALYPARFRMPPASTQSFSLAERIPRQELFALGSLLYEIATSTRPFAGLSDDEVQSRYCSGDFPDDLRDLPLDMLLAILSSWSLEFRALS